MTLFRVWAPEARRVEIKIGNEMKGMSLVPGGWWQAELPEAGPGTDYAFVLDGGSPLPDPRSLWQPQGVHEPSRVYDQAAYEWADSGWRSGPLGAGVIYELHIGTFTSAGDFDAAIEKLDYLRDLGVTHLNFMPVVEFPGERGWGYDGVDIYAPHHAYGGPDGLKRLVDACHQKGLAVILDVVYNHLGPEGNYLGQFGPYYTGRHMTPWGQAVNLDGPGSDEVRRFFIDNALMWLRDYHMDGLRLDAVHAMIDTSAVHFLEQLAVEVQGLEMQLGRPLALVAESDLNDPRLVQRREVGGYGLDAQWSDDFHHALHTVLTREKTGYYVDFGNLADLAQAIEEGYVYQGRYSEFRQRSHGRPPVGVPAYRFIGYLQNHDQVGNQADGKRIGQRLDLGRLKIGSALALTAPFVPLLFMGEEWNTSAPFQYFTHHQDPGLAEAVSKGRQEEFSAFGWKPSEVPDPQAEETFQRSKLNWSELDDSQSAELHDWYCKLIGLRRDFPALVGGGFDNTRVRFEKIDGWMVVERMPLSVACNLSDTTQRVRLPASTRSKILLASHENIRLENGTLQMPARSVAVVM